MVAGTLGACQPAGDGGFEFTTAAGPAGSDTDPPGDTSGSGDTSGNPSEATGDAPSATGEGPDSSGSSGEVPETPAFACDAVPATSPRLAGDVLFDPAAPHPGDTVTVVVRATNGLERSDAPSMQLQVETASGIAMLEPGTIEGGEAIYYYAIENVPLGDLCLTGLVDGAVEVSAKVAVTARPPDPEGPIFKVRQNHMWTCEEQPTNGNELHVWVRDESGVGLAGQVVRVQPADTTSFDSIYNADEQPLPPTIETDADGHAQLFNYWPVSDNGLLVLEVSLADAASDTATEITTGWWETAPDGCNYCSQGAVNVWGHWSHTVEFQRDPLATELCVVGSDHAGMAACGEPRHIHHGQTPACWVRSGP